MKRLLLVLPLLAFALIFSGCDLILDKEATEDYTEVFKVSSGYNILDMDNKAGDVVVTATPTTDSIMIYYIKKCMGTSYAEAEDHLNDIDVTIIGDTATHTVKVGTDFPDVDIARNYQVTFNVIIPDTMNLTVVNTTGDVRVLGMNKKPYLETTTGDIEIKDFECEVDAKATTGTVDCEITKLPENGKINLETTTGDAQLVVAVMDTTNVLSLEATTGTIDVTLPAAVRLEFDMAVTTGEVRINDYTYEQGSPWSNKHKVGTIGVGPARSRLDAVTETGDITLIKGD